MAASATTELRVTGMTCNNCARHVTEALREVPGVAAVQTSLEAGEAVVRWSPATMPSIAPLVAALKEAGYGATEKTDDQPQSSIFSGWKFNVIFGSAVTLPLVVLEWGFGVGMAVWYKWLSFALVLPLQVFGGGAVLSGGVAAVEERALEHGHAGVARFDDGLCL